jgi:leader peptidase (prepilin peptidase)/N-methyltransferase
MTGRDTNERTAPPTPSAPIERAVVISGALLAGLVAAFPPTGADRVAGIALALWILAATGIAAIDHREHRIPNRLVLGLTAATLFGLAMAAVGPGQSDGDPARAARTVIFAVIVLVVLFVFQLVSGGGLGMGDVKLSFPTALVVLWFGAGTGWLTVAVTVLSAAAVVLIRMGLRRPQVPLPLAPFIVIGVGVALLAHP